MAGQEIAQEDPRVSVFKVLPIRSSLPPASQARGQELTAYRRNMDIPSDEDYVSHLVRIYFTKSLIGGLSSNIVTDSAYQEAPLYLANKHVRGVPCSPSEAHDVIKKPAAHQTRYSRTMPVGLSASHLTRSQMSGSLYFNRASFRCRGLFSTHSRTLTPGPNMSSPQPSTHPRVALITGAARGIGRGIALRLASDGFDVALNDLPSSAGELADTAEEIKKVGRRAFCVLADVSDEGQVSRMVRAVVAELGSIDVVRNVSRSAAFGTQPARRWSQTQELVTRAACSTVRPP
jgi:hypothetical protein